MFEKTFEILKKINGLMLIQIKSGNINFKKGKLILRYFVNFFVSFFVISGFYGCDVCNVGQSQDSDATDIFFSALPLNKATPGIFAVSYDGSNYHEIDSNGVLFSGPSRNKTIVFLRGETSIDTLLYTVKTNGDSLNKSSITATYNTVRNPVLSPDGKYLSLFIGNGQLIIVKNMFVVQYASYNFCFGTNPTFSPDGKYLAFYEGSIHGPLIVKVVSSENPKTVVFQDNLTDGIVPWHGETGIEWSSDSRSIIFMFSNSVKPSDVICIDDINGVNNVRIEVAGIGAFMPVLSPDKLTIAFAARDGSIWIKTIADGRNFKMTDADTSMESNLYPQWTNDGNSIFYKRFFKDAPGNNFNGNLEIVNVRSLKRIVLSNNVFRGFMIKKTTQ